MKGRMVRLSPSLDGIREREAQVSRGGTGLFPKHIAAGRMFEFFKGGKQHWVHDV